MELFQGLGGVYTAGRVIASLRSAGRANLDNKVGNLAYCAQIAKRVFLAGCTSAETPRVEW